jgi:hypothetical protein
MELNKRKQFSKEQLINLTREDVEFWQERNELIPSMHTSMRLYQAEIALAVLTAEKAPREYRNGWPLAYSDYAAGRNDCLDELLDLGEGDDN